MPKYLIRLDDACHQSNWDNWDKIQQLFSKYKIKPIVGVIPSNRDQKFKYSNINDKLFWKKVKEWESIGWTIGMHGYDHVYITNEPGIVPISNKSEFAGLSLSDQRDKIKKSWDIFSQHSIKPTIWVAPSHSFDLNTLEALSMDTKINIISDGIALNAYYQNGFYWIPQQLWKLRRICFGKIWTVCLHPNTMSNRDFFELESNLKKYNNHFSNIDELCFDKEGRKIQDYIFYYIYFILFKIKKLLK